MPLPIAMLAIGSAYLMGHMGMQAKKDQRERQTIVSVIDGAVKSGSPEALELLNPTKLERYGLLELMPTYMNLAGTVQKQRQREQRSLEAVTRLQEVQARVGAATEESQINLSKQKSRVGAIELEQAEAQQQILQDNPKLLMLPFEKQQMEVQNLQSQIQSRTDQTKIELARLGEMTRHHRASEGIQGQGMKVGQLLEGLTMKALADLPEEERNAVLLQRLAPGVESGEQKKLDMYNTRFENASKTWQGVVKHIKDVAVKEGREEFTYKTKDAAESDALRLNKAALEQNFIGKNLSKFGDDRPEAPMFEVVPIPGWTGKDAGGYRLVIDNKVKSQADELLERALQGTGGATPTEKKPAEAKPPAESSGRRTFVDPNRGRAQRGLVGEKKEVK